MNDRLAKDAADTLIAFEANTAARRARMVARWKASQATGQYPGPRPKGPAMPTWAPTMTPQQEQAQDEQIAADRCPF